MFSVVDPDTFIFFHRGVNSVIVRVGDPQKTDVNES